MLAGMRMVVMAMRMVMTMITLTVTVMVMTMVMVTVVLDGGDDGNSRNLQLLPFFQCCCQLITNCESPS